jgi:hypothetical protein
MTKYCKCHGLLNPRQAVKDVVDEVKEMVAEPSMDEFSDIIYAIGRLMASLIGKVYIPLPGDGRHVAKIDARMLEYGCIRSKRHLVGGVCPTFH